MRTPPPRPLRRRLSSLFSRLLLPPAAAIAIASALATPAAAISWSVDASVLVAIQSSMVLDGSGNIHLALLTSSGTILYKERVGGAYGATETVDGASGHANPLIAVDGSGTPNIVYRTSTNLYFAKRYSATQWGGFVNNSSPDLITTGLSAFQSMMSFALDPSGNPHVLYYVSSAAMLRHAWHDASGWHIEDVYPESNGIPSTLTFDASGTLHAALSDLVFGELRYKIKNGSGWQPSELVFSNYGGGVTPSIAIASDGQPRISFTKMNSDHTTASLAYVARGTSSWGTPVVIDNTSNVGADSRLALESDLARITYWDKTNWDVRSAWQCAGGSWDVATIDAAPNSPAPGAEPGPAWLALRSNGAPVVYYSDFAQSRVKDATNGAATSISTLGTAFGRTTSTTSFTLPTDCSGNSTPLAWEVRFAASAITSEANWNAASSFATGSSAPGSGPCIAQTDLPSCTQNYFFAAKYTNRYGVLSGLSNSAGGHPRCTGSIEVSCDGFSLLAPPSDDSSAPSFALFVRGANPTSSPAGLGYVVPSSGVGARMRLGIFDVSGRVVRTLASGTATEGAHEAIWNLQDDAGRAVPRGLYFARFVLGNEVKTRTILVTR